MGFSKKHQDLEDKKWVIAGITMRPPLKSLSTAPVKEDHDNLNSGQTTPTSKASRIPEAAACACPPPPRKRRPVSTCHNHANREFFTSPELDNLFKLLSKPN